MLILYLITLLNLSMNSSSFLVLLASLGSSMYGIMSSENSDSCSFLIWISFISFPSLTVMVKASKTVLNKSGESGHPCLILNLRGNAFNISPLRMMLAVGLSYMAFVMLK